MKPFNYEHTKLNIKTKAELKWIFIPFYKTKYFN